MNSLWDPHWADKLVYFYIVLAIVFFIAVTYFWTFGPIQIAQICCLGFIWSLFGISINKAFGTKKG